MKPDGKSKKPRGDIRVGITLSTEKDTNITSHEHRHLLKILFAHELQRTQVIFYSNVCLIDLVKLTEHVAWKGLTRVNSKERMILKDLKEPLSIDFLFSC